MVESASIKGGWDNWSIKDSFAILDLSQYGFTQLFKAQWIYIESAKFSPHGLRQPLKYNIVSTEDELSAWKLAWGANPQ